MTTPRERLHQLVDRLDDDEVQQLLAQYDDDLSDDERRAIGTAMDAMDRGERLPHEQVLREARETIERARKKAVGE